MTRRRLIIILLLVFIVLPLISFIIYLSLNGGRATVGQEVTYKDKDTGETVSTFSGVQEESEGNPDVLILGLTELNSDVLKVHFNFIRDSINTYSNERLKGAYKVIAFLPNDYKSDGQGNISSTLRLGEEGSVTVPIKITASRYTGEVRVVIEDPENKFGGQYDSGINVFTAD